MSRGNTSPHGTLARAKHGPCDCVPCRRAVKAYDIQRTRLLEQGIRLTIPCDRSRRKVRALAVLGWSAADIGKRLGITQQAMSRILLRDRIRSATAERIDRVYDELEMKIPEDNEYTRRTKNAARKAGWLPPLAYDDIDAGILAETVTDRIYGHDRFDLEVIDYVMQYHDFAVKMSPVEKSEVVRRWKRNGGSERQLCILTGWKEGRYKIPAPTGVSEPDSVDAA